MSRKSLRVAIMLDLQWPYKRHASIFAGIQEYAKAHGWVTIIDEFIHNTLRESSAKQIPYDGVIARANLPLVEQARKKQVPVVNVWASSPAHNKVIGVYPDSILVGRELAEHLLSRGFRSLGTLTSSENLEHVVEVAEFQRCVSEAGFSCISAQIPQNPWQDLLHWRKTEEEIERWMDQWRLPIGVYVGSEGCGRMVVQACHRRGWHVPTEVAIIAGKNEETLCEHPHPSLTSMEIGYDRIGYQAAQLLHRMIRQPKKKYQSIRLPPQGLLVRESTDFFAVNDPMVAAALRFISANCHRAIGPDAVAHAIAVETRTLQNHFRKALARPVAAEIRRLRLERAKRELTQSQRAIDQIARDAGFGSATRMGEVFQRELGLTPSEYRRQRRVNRSEF